MVIFLIFSDDLRLFYLFIYFLLVFVNSVTELNKQKKRHFLNISYRKEIKLPNFGKVIINKLLHPGPRAEDSQAAPLR